MIMAPQYNNHNDNYNDDDDDDEDDDNDNNIATRIYDTGILYIITS